MQSHFITLFSTRTLLQRNDKQNIKDMFSKDGTDNKKLEL